ncbi:TonB-dependent receptor plug domain-containing protein [Puia sp. P3]|uniref:TonB-dependent receptor plug domain-containing protein n=1 Tax=Puia sp. P3 TaxID=3423952 RepID=UPI003D669F55
MAGLTLVRSNSGPVGTNKIILRGENNLTGDNEALIVVDGVVINQGSGRRSAISGEVPYGTSSDNMPADYGSNTNDLNPEDIESVQILKVPAPRPSTVSAAPTGPSSSPPSRAASGRAVSV